MTKVTKNRLILFSIVTTIIALLSVVAVIAMTIEHQDGYKMTEDGNPIIFCGDVVPIYSDGEVSVSDIHDLVEVYQPYTPELIYMGESTVPMPQSVFVTMGNPSDDYAAQERTTWDENGCVQASTIVLTRDYEGWLQYMNLCHEFGHSMGLEHSLNTWSAMHDPPGGITCGLTEKEQNILRDLYGKEE
jgi:hypothetical protein